MRRPTGFVLIFNSLHRVLRAEEILETTGAAFEVIPVPRRLTSDCGLAVHVAPASRTVAARALERAGHLPEQVHRLDGRDWVPTDLLAVTGHDDEQ